MVARKTSEPSTLPSKSPHGDRVGQRISVPNETHSPVTFDDERQVLRGRLNQYWQKAVADFKADTGEDLGDFRDGKNGVLGTLQERYSEDNKDTKKKDALWAVVDKALYCITFLGDIAAQVGSLLFEPSEVCFHALQKLINIPQEFKKLRDNLRGLFDQTVNFLTNFRILARVDSQLGLDTALVEKTNEILIALVDICRLSCSIPRHKFLTVMGNIFLKDDKVGAALDRFKGLIEEQTRLTSTVTLEVGLQTRAETQNIGRTVTKIGEDVNGISMKMDYIEAFQTDDKNLKANQEKIAEIDTTFGITEAEVRQPLYSLEQCRRKMLDNTIDVLATEDLYKDWSSSKARRKLLFLQGERGSGRTYLLAALLRGIYHEMNQLKRNDHKLYVAYYTFRREDDTAGANSRTSQREDSVGSNDWTYLRDGTIGANSWTHLQEALKVMASQIARQSEIYTMALHKNLDAIKDASTLDELWRALTLDDFDAPDDSTLYLFFDGLEQSKTSRTLLKSLKRALDPATSTADRSWRKRWKLRLRVIFTGNKETLDITGQKMPTIDMKQLNKTLLKDFVEHEMGTMLHDGLALKQSAELVDAVLKYATGSFTGVIQRLEMIKKAVSVDLDFEELLVQIQSSKDSNSLQRGAEIIDAVCSKLSSEHQHQFKEVLYWTAFSCNLPTVEELEAVLFLRRQRESLEPLRSKIMTRFAPAVILKDNKVIVDNDVEQYMRDTDTSLDDTIDSSKITMELKVENVDESELRRFVWEFNNAIATERLDFASGLKQNKNTSKERLRFSLAEGHYTITIRCIQALSDSDDKTKPKTRALLRYAELHLPDHIWYLQSENCFKLLSPAQRRILGQSVVGFLADLEYGDSAWSTRVFSAWTWTYNRDNFLAIGRTLTDNSILQELDPRDRRVAERLSKQTRENPVPFLKYVATETASLWLEKKKATMLTGGERYIFHGVNAYLRMLEMDFNSLRFQPEADESAPKEAPESDSSQELTAATSNPDTQADEVQGSNVSSNDVGATGTETDANVSLVKTNSDTLNGQPSSMQGKTNEDARSSTDELNAGNDDNVGSTSESKTTLGPEDVTRDRVKEAMEWSLKQLGLEADSFVYQRLGHTLVDIDTAAAIEYLKQAYDTVPAGNFTEKLEIADALADAHTRSDTTEAYNALSPIIEESRSLREEKGLSNDEESRLFTTLMKAAGYLTDKQDDTGAIRVLEDALACSPHDGTCRSDLIRLLCKTKKLTEARELFNQWMSISADDKTHGPIAHFVQAARAGQYDALCAFFHSAQQSPLHKDIIQALTVAIGSDGDGTEYSDKSALHFTRGLALAIIRDDEALAAAGIEWMACLDNYTSRSIEDTNLLKKCSMCVAQYHFDIYRSQLLGQPQMSIAEKTDILRRLEDTVEVLSVQADTSSVIARTTWSYVAAYATLAGLDEDAKLILRTDMAMAIRILRDDDPENDSYGLSILIDVLRCCGDISGLHSVFSLYDRKLLAKKREEKWAAQLVTEDSGTNSNNNDNKMQHVETTPRASSQDAASTSGISRVRYSVHCDGCGTEIDSSKDQELWSCMFCPDTDFCGECYPKLKNKQLDKLICSHEHVHNLMLHFDYDKEEVQGENIRVDWHFVGQDNDKARRREGGRIMNLQDWLDELARDWDVHVPSS